MTDPPQTRAADPRPAPLWLWALAAALLLLAAGVFTVRGPVRGLHQVQSDIRIIYPLVLGWVQGVNPYDAEALDPLWLDAGGPPEALPSDPIRGSEHLLYPPPTALVLSPLALLDWPAARAAWVATNTTLLLLAAGCLAGVAGLTWRRPEAWLFVAAALGLGAGHTALFLGQTSIAATAAVAAALYARVRGFDAAVGVLLAVACCIKPQIGGFFAVFELLLGRWRTVAWGAGTLGVLLAVSVGRLELAGVPWLASLSSNVDRFVHGSLGDPTRAGPLSYQLMNLHHPLHLFTDHRGVVTWAVRAVAGGGAVAIVWLTCRRSDRRAASPTTYALVAVLSLVVIYHRYYDAVLLLIPLAWAARDLAQHRAVPWAVLAPLAVMFVNGPALARRAELAGWLPEALTGLAWGRLVLFAHQAVLLLVVGGALLLRQAQRGAGRAAAQEKATPPGGGAA